MKKKLLPLLLLAALSASAQEHFTGISTSRRTGLLNANINPAELVNLTSGYEVSVFNISANTANNKVTFGDIVNGNNIEDKIFSGSEAVNFRADVEILGPGFAMKIENWAFAITSAAKVKADLVDIDTNLGNSLINSTFNSLINGEALINTNYNQKATATSWGEIGFSAAREIYNDDKHKFSGGLTFKLLFPGSYANLSADRFQGAVINNSGDVTLTDASAMVNLAYSGSLANGFDKTSNYTRFFAGGLNGSAVDIGLNYQLKTSNSDNYRINAGVALRNLGSMKFKDNNNVSRNYSLQVGENESLDLNQFEGSESLPEIERILLNNPQFFTADSSTRNFKVKMPALFSAYADVMLYTNWYVTAYTQQKLNDDSENAQIAIQNIVTVTPRYSMEIFEGYIPLSINEISGFTAGVGIRLGGFHIGSGSVLSAMLGNTDQADAYVGFRFGI